MRGRKPRVALLLGAGSSIPAGFPRTDELTRRVLSGENISRHSNGTFYFSAGADGAPCKFVTLVATVANSYQQEIDGFFHGRYNRPANYEDIYYLASQLAEHANGELDNPALCRLIDHLSAQFSRLMNAAALPGITTFPELTRETANYIFDTVWRSLAIHPSQTSHLKPIERLCRSSRFDRVSLGTLCHDTHVEDFLSCRGVAFVDGFSSPEHGVRYSTPSLLNGNSNDPLLLKLHGSISWFRLRPDNGTWYDERIGIALDGDYQHTRDSHGRLQMPVPGRPLFLVGTFNKIADYSHQLFGALLTSFRAFLSSADRVVVCGYSFGDKGINAALIDWLYSNQNRRLIVVHRDPDAVRAGARGAIADKWDYWTGSGCLLTIQKWLEDLNEDELELHLAG